MMTKTQYEQMKKSTLRKFLDKNPSELPDIRRQSIKAGLLWLAFGAAILPLGLYVAVLADSHHVSDTAFEFLLLLPVVGFCLLMIGVGILLRLNIVYTPSKTQLMQDIGEYKNRYTNPPAHNKGPYCALGAERVSSPGEIVTYSVSTSASIHDAMHSVTENARTTSAPSNVHLPSVKVEPQRMIPAAPPKAPPEQTSTFSQDVWKYAAPVFALYWLLRWIFPAVIPSMPFQFALFGSAIVGAAIAGILILSRQSAVQTHLENAITAEKEGQSTQALYHMKPVLAAIRLPARETVLVIGDGKERQQMFEQLEKLENACRAVESMDQTGSCRGLAVRVIQAVERLSDITNRDNYIGKWVVVRLKDDLVQEADAILGQMASDVAQLVAQIGEMPAGNRMSTPK